MNQLFNFLECYASFTESERDTILTACTWKYFHKNEFFLQDKKQAQLAILMNGAFRSFHTNESGDEINVEFILDRGFITALSRFTENGEHFFMQAMEHSEIIILDWQQIQAKESLYSKFKLLNSMYRSDVCLPALLNYQFMMSATPNKRYEFLIRTYPHYLQRIAQKHIASYLRLRPETVSRIRKNLVI